MPLQILDDFSVFSDPSDALVEPNGLLAIGGDLSVERLLAAYKKGIFPWYNHNDPILWWSPNPRAVLYPSQLYCNRSFNKFLRRCDYQVTLNTDFAMVIKGCAQYHDDTWINDEMLEAYIKMHQLGFAHSIEVWQNERLIGGLYGVAIGTLFCGESMFSVQTNASKVGLYAFCQHFHRYGGKLMDCQVLNSHTASLGAKEIPRDNYLSHLNKLQNQPLPDECYKQQLIEYHKAIKNNVE